MLQFNQKCGAINKRLQLQQLLFTKRCEPIKIAELINVAVPHAFGILLGNTLHFSSQNRQSLLVTEASFLALEKLPFAK